MYVFITYIIVSYSYIYIYTEFLKSILNRFNNQVLSHGPLVWVS